MEDQRSTVEVAVDGRWSCDTLGNGAARHQNHVCGLRRSFIGLGSIVIKNDVGHYPSLDEVNTGPAILSVSLIRACQHGAPLQSGWRDGPF